MSFSDPSHRQDRSKPTAARGRWKERMSERATVLSAPIKDSAAGVFSVVDGGYEGRRAHRGQHRQRRY